ncbi:hypothetical protein [Brevundimonas lenta]|uniref:DUF1579 domain-containing protein n=1 Tax=Brevundimonas lenta TaxID=424796 RepID=A0A7W6NQA8_9CAUL|nr:hypothetical protein [Brevundimonas lenta]MBB4083688.1 hypothetical protein [Brevundimonas lenta]
MIHFALIAALLQTAPVPVDCADADHSAFNFWIGDWDVLASGTDVVVARSVIAPTVDGCGIREDYRQSVAPGGESSRYQGASVSAFDARSRTWRQFYVDSAGTVTIFEGGVISDGAMVLIGPGHEPDELQMMTVTPQADGTVRQVGANSIDGGSSWSTGSYDFTYRRR